MGHIAADGDYVGGLVSDAQTSNFNYVFSYGDISALGVNMLVGYSQDLMARYIILMHTSISLV